MYGDTKTAKQRMGEHRESKKARMEFMNGVMSRALKNKSESKDFVHTKNFSKKQENLSGKNENQ